MFKDGRSKKVVFIAHCLLNQNSISDGTAVAPAAVNEVIEYFLSRNIGIVQMPCPEMRVLGLDRGDVDGAKRDVVEENTRIRRAMQEPDNSARLAELVQSVVCQIEEYISYGFEVVGIIGANRSPSCGIETTSNNNAEICGMGLFAGGIKQSLAEKGISIPMTGIKTSEDITAKLDKIM